MAKRRRNPDSKVLAAILLVGGAAVYFLTRSSASAGEQGGSGDGGLGSGDGGLGSGDGGLGSGNGGFGSGSGDQFGRNQALPEGWGNTPLDPNRFRQIGKRPPRLIFPTVAEQMARPYEFPGKPAPISVPNLDNITARDRQRALNWYRDLMVAFSAEKNRVSALQSAQSVSRGFKPSPVWPKIEPFARLAEDGLFGPLSTAAADHFQQTFMSAINKPQAAGTKVFQRFLPDPPAEQFADPLEAVDYLVLGATDPSMFPTPPELFALYMAARSVKGV